MTKPLSVFDLMASSNTQIQTPTESTEPRLLSVFDLMGDRSRLNADTAAIGRRYAQELDSQALLYPKEATQQLYPMAMKYRSDMDNHFAARGYTEEQRKQILDSFDTSSAFLNPTDGTVSTYITDPLKTVGKGVMNFGANVVSAVAPQSDLAHELKSAADAYDVSRSADSQMKALRFDTDIQRDIAGGTNESWATLKHLALNPSQIGNAALENLPQLMFAPAGAAALGAMGVAQGVGSYRNATMEAWKALPKAEAMAKPEIQQRMAQGMTFEQALEDVSTDVSDHLGGIARSAAIGALDTLSPLGKLGAVGQAANRGMVKTFGKEVGKEYLQEGAEQANENYGVGQIDGTTQLMDGVQQAAVTGALASGPFAAVAAYDAKRNDNRLGAQESKDTSTGSLDADEQDIQQSQSEQTQPAQAVENPQHFAETPDYPELDQFALNKAMETLDEEVRQDYTARLARELANGKAQARNGKGEFDRFVQDYLAQTQVPEVVRQMEQAASTLPEANATPNTPNPNSSTFGNATEQSDAPALKLTSVQNGGMTEIELGSQGRKPATFQLIEADDLTVNLKPNAYQNRDRTSADSQAQIMAYAANLNPSYLGASVDTTQGAPVVDEHYGVFAGNGRLAAIKQAYAKNPQSATAYRDYLIQNAAQFGLMPEQVQGMRQPVLVRQMSSDIDLKKAVEDSNFNTGLDKGVLGNARANADYLSDELLDLAETKEDGSLSLSESNTPFIQGLVAKVPVEHRPRFFAEKKLGNQTVYTLTAQGRELVENALLVKAYSDGSTYADNLLTDLITGTEDSNKRVKAALISVAGKVIQTKGTDYDISADLVQAYDLMIKGKKAGLNAEQAAVQGDMLNQPNETVQGLVGLFYSPKSISEVQQPLNAYLGKVIDSKLRQTEQGGLFEDEKPSHKELLNQAGMKASRSAMKSVEANIKRGKQAMNTAITERRTVHRAMFNHELGGWVDFEWGDDGLTKPFNKKGEPVGKGIAHIIEARQRKDGMSYQDVVRMLTNNVVETIAKGEVVHQKRNDKFKEDRITIDFDKYRVALLKRDGGNAWIITGFEKFADGERSVGNDTTTPTHPETTLTRQGVGASENQEMNQSRGATTSDLRSTDPIRSRIGEVALGANNVRPTAPNVNPQLQKDRAELARRLGAETAAHIELIDGEQFARMNRDMRLEDLSDVEGFFDPRTQKAYIVANQITARDGLSREENLAWVAWHELSHKGLAGRYGEKLQRILSNLHNDTLLIKRLVAARQARYVGEPEMESIEEVVVELSSALRTGKWDSLISRYGVAIPPAVRHAESYLGKKLRAFVRLLSDIVGKAIGRKITHPDLALLDLLSSLQRDVQKFAENPQNQTASNVDAETRYSLNENADSEFSKAVDTVSQGGKPSKQYVPMGTTPTVLKMLGLPDTKVLINRDVLNKVMQDKHNVTAETLKQLPQQINNPVAVMKSAPQATQKGYIVLTELVEENAFTGQQEPVISALHLRNTKDGMEVINIASVYGKNLRGMQNMLNHDLLYWHNEKGSQFVEAFGLQLPSKIASTDVSLGSNVKTEQDLSQYRAENSTHYSRKPQDLSQSTYEQAKENGETELTFQQWKQVRSPEFKAWFGDWENNPDDASKVINPRTGEPLVVYHGTPNGNFSIFNSESYFSPSEDYATRYQNPSASSISSSPKTADNPTTYAVYLDIKKPFDTRIPEVRAIFERDFFRKWGNGSPLSENGLPDWTDATDLLEFIEENEFDFDGLILDEGADGGYDSEVIKRPLSYVPVNANQIKSATDNNGDFSAENDDIRYSRRPKSESLEKLRRSETIRISGTEIEPSEDFRQYRRNAMEYGKSLRGSYTNKDTGQIIELGRAGITEVLHHDLSKPEHLQSIAAIPQIIENAVYIDTLPNEDVAKNPHIKEYDYYAAGLNISGTDYTVKAAVSLGKNGDRYYDHKLTQIEKGKLLSLLDRLSNAGASENYSPLSEVDDKRLLQILQDNSDNPRYSRKKSAMDIADAEKVEQHPNLIERVQKGGYAQFKKELTALSAFIDTQLHDRLRPVMDWIDGINLPSLSAYEKAKIKDSIYAAEGIKSDLLVQAELRYLNDIRDKIAAIAKAHFNGHGETAMKKAGLWISTRWAIERNALLLAADEKAMNEAEAAYNEAVAKSEPMTVQNRLERSLIKAENVYYNRIKDVNSTDFSNDRRYKEGVAGGWSTPLAKAIMAKMESQIPRKELEALAEVVYNLNDWQLKQNVESGRYTPEEAAHFKSQGRHYVPLTGDPSMELDDALRMPSNRNPNVSKDVSLKGRTLSEADDAISTVWESMQKTATYSGWAPMKHQFANLYDQAYQQVIASGATPEQAATEAKKLTGIEKEKLQGLTRTSDDVLIYKSGGVYYQLSIPEIAITQIKKQNSDNTPPLLKPMQTVTGWYARGVTQFKPHFAMVNMVRDLWEKSELVRTKEIFDKHGKPLPEKVKNQIGREMWKQAFGAIAGQNTDVWLAAKRYARKQELRDNVPAERELKALLKNGGVSTHSTFLERKETDLIKTINKRNSRLAKGIEYALNAVETYNRIFDIISAIAANRALLKHGVDQKHASAVTLDLTNFRKQGDRMPFIKSFYMFAQPAAIGGANLIRMMKTDVGRKRLLMSSLFFGALSFMLRSLFDEDEAGNGLFKEGDIDRYIPIPIPGSDLLFKLPVGYGAPQLSWNLGYNLTQAIMGDKTWGDAAGSVALHAFKAVAPVSPSDVPVSDYPAVKALMTAMPTIVKPIAEIALNRNAFGSPITGAFLNDKSLKAEQAKAQTAPFWTETALWLNDTFGMDFAPEQVKHFVQGYANIVPLASESLTILVENPNKARQGKTESIPFINAVVGSQNQYATQTQFYRFRDQANETVINFESRKTRGTLPESWKSDPDMRWQRNWFARVEEMEKAQRKTKVSLTKAHNTGKLSAEAYQSRLNALAKETEAKQKKLVGAWRFHYGLNTTATKD